MRGMHGAASDIFNRLKHGRRIEQLKQISAGRCAWVSYYLPGQSSEKYANEKAAENTYKRLATSDPKHLSPLMHQATPLPRSVRVANLCGFLQFRKQIPGESGGEKVVDSITPEHAADIIYHYEWNRHNKSRIGIEDEKAFVFDTMEP